MRQRHRHWGVPPSGLRRKIFWSLIGSALMAGLLALLCSLLWRQPPAGAAIALCAVVTAWLASGRIAWRIARPLNRLAGVVERYGMGDLSARAGFPRCRNDEMTRVAVAFDEMADRIERQVKEERQLLAVVSHEMRTPMARIRVLTDLARSGQATALDDIDREVVEIDALVANLLARSRLEFGTGARQPMRLPEAVSEALERAGLDASRLLTDSGDRAWEAVSIDPTLLYRALANLIDNAQHHGGGLAAVTVTAAAAGVQVEFLDDGPGFGDVPGEQRFQFPQNNQVGADTTGLGLGLSLVRRIIEAHGGRVWAENRDAAGARVGFELPYAA